MEQNGAPASGQQSDEWMKEAERLIRDYGQACFLSRSHAEMNAARAAIVAHLAARATLPAACAEQGEAVAVVLQTPEGKAVIEWQVFSSSLPHGTKLYASLPPPARNGEMSDEQIMEAVRDEVTFYPDECNLIDQTQMLRIARAILSAFLPQPEMSMLDAKDAARYRWLRQQSWFDGELCVLRNPKRALTSGAGLGADCPSRERLDAAIDAALSASCAPKQTEGDGK